LDKWLKYRCIKIIKKFKKRYKKGECYLNKKIMILITLILLPIIIISGCINDDKPKKPEDNNLDQSAPIVTITAPDTGYFGDLLVFDASNSYDPDGEILSYEWDFGDGQNAEGEKVEHIYEFEKNFDIEYPLIYTIILNVKDNDENLKINEYQIRLFPSEYIFYLDSGKITTKKPILNEDTIGATGKFKIKPAQEITYELEEPIKIQKCKWNATVHLKKPILTAVDRILITLYNEIGVEISKGEISFRQLELWNEKSVLIENTIDKQEDFKSVKISISGFSLRKKISILYGGEKASQICFNFRT
jgi:hypothetical protein